MIKQIQLRGISRTPSDKMSEDGGLSESLNMYLDTAENAPAFIPQDVTSKLGLPADLQAEKMFIHKTANYENYIVVESDRIVAYTPNKKDDVEPLVVLELHNEESVNDITSIGNTLIISCTANLYYVLYKESAYSFLGNKVPFPQINFNRTEIEKIEFETKSVGLSNTGGERWFLDDINNDYIPSESSWNLNSENGKSHTGAFKKCIDALRDSVQTAITEATTKGFLTSPVFMRYEVDIYGSSVSSMPILLPSTVATKLFAQIQTIKNISYDPDESDGGSGWIEYFFTREEAKIISQPEKYKIFAQAAFSDDTLRDWKDIITSVKIYMSQPIDWGVLLQSTILSSRDEKKHESPAGGEGSPMDRQYVSSGIISFRENPEYVETLLNTSALTYLIKEIPFFDPIKNDISEGIKTLMSGEVLDVKEFIENQEKLLLQDRLSDDDMKHYALATEKLGVFNNRLLLPQPTQIIDYDYNRLNAYDVITHESTGKAVTYVTYDVTYLLRTYRNDKCIKKQFTYCYSVFGTERIYAFQIFPDRRAYKMIVKATVTTSGVNGLTEIKYGEFNMLPHPYLDCAYYYGGVENELVDLCTIGSIKDYNIDQIDDLESKLFVSSIDNPFDFPIDSRYTFQSKVLGVAIATTALSQGQFGQFPLYVFTEDGIWVMETASDGSFISQKPLSREVCTNPDSITSIDNAVVFVTDKGVMMIQGSQVMNISPFMNGRHYIPNESATNIIAKQEGFSEFENVINDETPFVAFMKKAKIAYDYAGQRLICIADGESFQYIYKIDTQTWHKVAFKDFDLIDPLNSYPDCLVRGHGLGVQKKCVVEINSSKDGKEYLIGRVKEYFPSLSDTSIESFLYDQEEIDVTSLNEGILQDFQIEMSELAISTIIQEKETTVTKIYSLGTILDLDPEAEDAPKVAKGILITRPFDLGMPDVFKSITSIKIRGDFDKGNVKYILQGSDDGKTFYTMNTLRGKSWKMFRIFILADLEPTERISWIDIDFEPRYNNRLR